MADLIDRQTAIETAIEAADKWDGAYSPERERIIRKFFDKVPAVHPCLQLTCNQLATDTISRQAAIDLFPDDDLEYDTKGGYVAPHLARRMICELPSAQPELTDEQSIAHLQSSGWMQRHDKEMYESGLKEQLADDSDSYDSLLPAVHPEVIRCKNCEHWKNEHLCKSLSRFGSFETKADFYCGYAERKINERTG